MPVFCALAEVFNSAMQADVEAGYELDTFAKPAEITDDLLCSICQVVYLVFSMVFAYFGGFCDFSVLVFLR